MPTERRHALVHPRDELLATMERIYRYRMTTTSGGNLSIRDDEGQIWITPARIDKGSLRRDDIVCVKPDGTVDGRHKPSSEFPFHRAIYEARPDLKAIVHAHPVALVAFSICRRAPETRLIHQARHVCGDVGFAPYALPGSQQLAENIAATFRQGYHCVILENHGVVVGGDDLTEAFQRFETLEFAGQTTIRAAMIGEVRLLTDRQLELSKRQAQSFPEFTPVAPHSLEKELRTQLRDFLKRGYQQRLFISTAGSFSARIGDDEFLITPYQRDRQRIELDDLVLIDAGRREAGKTPSRSAAMHRAIYRRHADIAAVVTAYPVHATAFCATNADLPTRTIPESYLFLRDVPRLPFELPFGDGTELAARISMQQPIALLDNDGVLVCGHSVLDAFDRLEVLETTAEAFINSRPLGPLVPMSDAVIDELCAAFGVVRKV
ncbi:MAG TPA: class II aldolase/adducin family protein [Planctomycetaceae bacterium]|nr:class II aldolase/adducin family protein [Planctomycetaceae bacterium]